MNTPSFILLSHLRELDRPTSTVRCLADSLKERLWQPAWQRTEPNEQLLSLISEQTVGLLYPDEQQQCPSMPAAQCEHWLILDGTWQEARKMYNRSPYLHALPRIEFKPQHQSEYKLRRNQKDDGLSTAECMIQLLNQNQETRLAAQLLEQFRAFNSR